MPKNLDNLGKQYGFPTLTHVRSVRMLRASIGVDPKNGSLEADLGKEDCTSPQQYSQMLSHNTAS